MKTKVVVMVESLFDTLDCALEHGSLWLSDGFGTMNRMAGVLSDRSGESYEEIRYTIAILGPMFDRAKHCALSKSSDWYLTLQDLAERKKTGKTYAWTATLVAEATNLGDI
jgi:hypothetical protein